MNALLAITLTGAAVYCFKKASEERNRSGAVRNIKSLLTVVFVILSLIFWLKTFF